MIPPVFHASARRKLLTLVAVASSLLALGSCKPTPEAGGGIGGTGSITSVASGPVTELSSVSVSGTEYDNGNTVYCMDGEPCSRENKLKLGMVILVKGTAGPTPEGGVTRIANTITFEETIEGVVQSVTPDGSMLIVLGQVIQLNQKTVIDPSIPGRSIVNLTPGLDVIEVSGLVTGDGHVLATFISRRTGTPHYEVEGVIKNHNVEKQRFEIGRLVVNYSFADVSDLARTSMVSWDGQLVHVRGDEWQPLSDVLNGASLTATRVKSLGLMEEDSPDAKIEGFLTSVGTGNTLAIHNHPIHVSGTTTFVEGTRSNLIQGAHVFIHGALVRQVLEAHEIQFKENVHLESNVESIDGASRSLTLVGLPQLVVESDGKTVVDDRGVHGRFEDIRIGDHLKVHARFVGGQRVAATELERTDPSMGITLEAPLEAASDPQLVLAGVTVDTHEISDDQFIGSHGAIGRMAFFQSVRESGPVWAKGVLSGGLPIWKTVGMKGTP